MLPQEMYTYSERKFHKESKNGIVFYVGLMVREKFQVEGEIFLEKNSELHVNFLFLSYTPHQKRHHN